jgi:hypothetical protein
MNTQIDNSKTQTAETAKYPEVVNHAMIDEAITIAQIISGTYDWQGMKGAAGTSGLICLVQEYLDSEREVRICNFKAYEDNGEYWCGWKQ